MCVCVCVCVCVSVSVCASAPLSELVLDFTHLKQMVVY